MNIQYCSNLYRPPMHSAIFLFHLALRSHSFFSDPPWLRRPVLWSQVILVGGSGFCSFAAIEAPVSSLERLKALNLDESRRDSARRPSAESRRQMQENWLAIGMMNQWLRICMDVSYKRRSMKRAVVISILQRLRDGGLFSESHHLSISSVQYGDVSEQSG